MCSKFTGEHSCRSVIPINLQGNFIEITLWHGCCPANLLHIFRTPFLKNTREMNKTREIISSETLQKMRQIDQFQTTLFFEKTSYEVKTNVLRLSFNIFRQRSTWHMIKTNCIKLQTFDIEICSNLILQKRDWEQFFHYILCMIF